MQCFNSADGLSKYLLIKHVFLISLVIFLLPAPINAKEKELLTFGNLHELNLSLDELIDRADQMTPTEMYDVSEYLSLRSHQEIDNKKLTTFSKFLLTKAAALGLPSAQWRLSLNLEYGNNGFEEDKRLAQMWYEEAQKNGFHMAQSSKTFDRRKLLMCMYEKETVTGVEKFFTTDISGSFFLDLRNSEAELFGDTIKCKLSVMTTPLFRIFNACSVNEDHYKGIPSFILLSTADNPAELGAPPQVYDFYVSMGFPDLVTIRQGKCVRQN